MIANVRERDTERMRVYGAIETIDQTEVSLVDAVRGAHPGGIDVLLDLVSDAPAFAALASLVKPGGTAVTTKYVADDNALGATGIMGINFALQPSSELFERVAEAVADGRIVAPPITRLTRVGLGGQRAARLTRVGLGGSPGWVLGLGGLGVERTGGSPCGRLAGLKDDRRDHDRAADDRRRTRSLAVSEPHPQWAEYDLEQADQRDLRGRDQPRADREQDQADADLPGAEQHQPQEIAGAEADAAADRERRRADQQHQLGEHDGRRHRDVTAVTSDHDRARKAERHQNRQAVSERAATSRRADHHAHPEQSDRHRNRGARAEPLAQDDEPQQRRQDGRDRLDEQHLRDRSMVQSDEERSRRERHAGRKGDARTANRAARLDHPAALGDDHIRGHRQRGKQSPSPDLRGYRKRRQLALEHPSRRPHDCRQRDRELAAFDPRTRDVDRRRHAGHRGKSTTPAAAPPASSRTSAAADPRTAAGADQRVRRARRIARHRAREPRTDSELALVQLVPVFVNDRQPGASALRSVACTGSRRCVAGDSGGHLFTGRRGRTVSPQYTGGEHPRPARGS